MSFPDTALIKFMYWLINTPGLGGIAVGMFGVSIISIVALTLRWIIRGGNEDEIETYSYPTTALHNHKE